MIQVLKVEGKGCAVFATMDIKRGVWIVSNVVIPFAWKGLPPTALDDYRMGWTRDKDCIALGPANLINHSDKPNVKIVDDKAHNTKAVVALRGIENGEELVVRYRCKPWFKVLPPSRVTPFRWGK